MTTTATEWTIASHLEYSDHNDIVVAQHRDGKTTVSKIETSPASGKDNSHVTTFWGVNNNNEALIFDPETKQADRQPAPVADNRFAYAYRDPSSARVWFMNDGGKAGTDTLACDTGSSVSIGAKTEDNADFVETICVGRGHHVTTFVAPDENATNQPHRAFVSNLKDGTISVIGNDPSDAVSFLKVISTINLADTRFEDGDEAAIPNNAFPHGMEYSSTTGKLYNLNNGYHTIAVINPMTHEIETTVEMKVSSNLLLSRCGNFLIGKGADRKANPDHVMGRLSVFDARKNEMVTILDLQDIYPSVYRFNPAGDKLYVTAAATGKGTQLDNLRTDMVQIYDASKLPELILLKEIAVSECLSGRRPIAFQENDNGAPTVFLANPSQGSMSVIDGDTDEVIETVPLSDGDITEFSFSFWRDRDIYGA